jgi:hypothetical protein
MRLFGGELSLRRYDTAARTRESISPQSQSEIEGSRRPSRRWGCALEDWFYFAALPGSKHLELGTTGAFFDFPQALYIGLYQGKHQLGEWLTPAKKTIYCSTTS